MDFEKKYCEYCRQLIKNNYSNSRFCSKECRIEFKKKYKKREEAKKEEYIKNCRQCRKIFKTNNEMRIYCSKACRDKWHQERLKKFRQENPKEREKYSKKINCINCGKEVIANHPSRKYCSQECGMEYWKKLNPKKKYYVIGNYKLRWVVLKRDNFKCVYCGRGAKDGAILHVDHKVPKSKWGEDTKENLVACCRKCNLGKRTDVI